MKRSYRGYWLMAVLLGAVAALLTFARPPAPAAQVKAKPAWEVRWEQVVAAAKREGVLHCTCIPIPLHRNVIMAEWQKDFPEIKMEYANATLPDIEPQITQERRAGRYIRDVYMWGSSPEMYVWDDQGFIQDIRDLLILPDVTDESKWHGGFAARFQDEEGRRVFAVSAPLQSISVNRLLVSESELSLPVHLMKPQFRGKIVIWDPRFGGAGANVLGWWNFLFGLEGENGVRALLTKQQPIIVPGPARNAVEKMARENVPIGFNVITEADMKPFRDAGFKLDIKILGRTPDKVFQGAGGFGVLIFKNNPHPNASIVFLNWILSKGVHQRIFPRVAETSARVDLDVGPEPHRPLPEVRYPFHGQSEKHIKEYRLPAMKLAREIIR